MYENVKKILGKSRETGEDVLVSADMVIAEEGRSDELLAAKEAVSTYYETITNLRRLKDEETIEKLCAAVEKGDKDEIFRIKEEVKNIKRRA